MAFNIRWRVVGQTALAGQVTGHPDLFLVLTALDPDTPYEWSVQEQVGAAVGSWSAWQPFQTLASGFSYNVEWRDVATQTTTPVYSVANPFFVLEGLTPGTAYEYRVQETDGTTLSPWSDWAPFTTLAGVSGVYRCRVQIPSDVCGTGQCGALASIDVVRGQGLDIGVTMPPGFDLTGALFRFRIADNPYSPYELELPVTVDGQEVTAILSSADCDSLTQTRHYYGLWLVMGGEATPIARGWINLSSDPRNFS